MSTTVAATHRPTSRRADGLDPAVAASLDRDHPVVASRFRGPPGMANGGWISGVVAERVGAANVQVDLRAPTPLDRALDLGTEGDGAVLWADDVRCVEARPTDEEVVGPAFVDPDDALEASRRFPGHDEHPFPGCFVCGPARSDGLRVLSGPVSGRDETSAAPWRPPADLADGDGVVVEPAVLAALDCPSVWAMSHLVPGVLASFQVSRWGAVHAGRPHVVVGQVSRRDGRKLWAGSALYTADGECLAATRSLWIAV